MRIDAPSSSGTAISDPVIDTPRARRSIPCEPAAASRAPIESSAEAHEDQNTSATNPPRGQVGCDQDRLCLSRGRCQLRRRREILEPTSFDRERGSPGRDGAEGRRRSAVVVARRSGGGVRAHGRGRRVSGPGPIVLERIVRERGQQALRSSRTRAAHWPGPRCVVGAIERDGSDRDSAVPLLGWRRINVRSGRSRRRISQRHDGAGWRPSRRRSRRSKSLFTAPGAERPVEARRAGCE